MWKRSQTVLPEEPRQPATSNSSDKGWRLALASALDTGLSVLIGTSWSGRLELGMLSAVGALVFLYLPSTPLSHRMAALMAYSFGMVACFTLGATSHLYPPAIIPTLTAIATLVTISSRFYSVAQPQGLLFLLGAAIGAYFPHTMDEVPRVIGLVAIGCLTACVIGFFYSLYMLRRFPPQPAPSSSFDFDYVVVDSTIIGCAVGISLAAAHALNFHLPYWVAVSCLTVIQEASLQAVWEKQLRRVVGTTIGLFVAWVLLSQPLGEWSIVVAIMLLTFFIKMLVEGYYAFAMIFLTPLILLLGESATQGRAPPDELIQARFFDTVLGCVVGLAGGICLHFPRFHAAVYKVLLWFAPAERRP